jgi:hypothetical protein
MTFFIRGFKGFNSAGFSCVLCCDSLQAGCPGPALTFDYLFCPLCGSGSEGRCGNIQVSWVLANT